MSSNAHDDSYGRSSPALHQQWRFGWKAEAMSAAMGYTQLVRSKSNLKRDHILQAKDAGWPVMNWIAEVVMDNGCHSRGSDFTLFHFVFSSGNRTPGGTMAAHYKRVRRQKQNKSEYAQVSPLL